MHSDRWTDHVDARLVGRQPLPAFAAVTAILVAVALIFWPTTASMGRTWAGSATFNHCFLVPPIFVWLVWQKRFLLAAAPVRPFWPALLGLAAAGAAWLLGSLASSVGATQWAVVALVPLAVAALFGTAWVRVLGFPLVFLFFAVPFGEIFVPTLIDRTADFTTFALRLVGVPVLREGADLSIPSGRWSVVEACSGVRFLIASVMAGSLYAHEMFRSPRRRAAFVAASVVVPIVANWLRAFMIVLIGHLSDNRIAAGVDHLVYGWFFFAFVLFLLFWVGSFWREEPVRALPVVPVPPAFETPVAAIVSALGVLVVWPIVLAALEVPHQRGVPPAPVIEGRNGWQSATGGVAPWRPVLVGADRVSVLAFAKGDVQVGVVIAHFRDQTQGRSAVNSQHRFVAERDSQWRPLRRGSAVADLDGVPTTVHAVVLASGESMLDVWQWNWSPTLVTGNDVLAKLALATDRLRGEGDDGAWVAIFAPAAGEGAAAAASLSAFAREMSGALHEALRTASRTP